MTRTTLRTIADQSLANGGGTFRADGTSPTEGIAVTVAILDTVQADDLSLALWSHQRRVADGHYLGTWFDHENGVWEISATAVFADLDDALALAKALDERYVYDLGADAEIAVP